MSRINLKEDKRLTANVKKALAASPFGRSLDGLINKTIAQISNRGKGRGAGGTPTDTGKLRQSLGVDPARGGSGTVGYSIEYAPFVEYGHRTRGGGFVAGQHFFADNIAAQEPILSSDLQHLMDNLFKG